MKGKSILIVLCVLLLALVACGDREHCVTIEPVDIDDALSENMGEFISFLHLGSVDSERIVLYNIQGLYVFEKKKDTFVLQSTISFAPLGIEIEGAEAARFVFSESAVQIIPGYPEQKPEDGMTVYEYYYKKEKLTKQFLSWNEIERLSGWEHKPDNFNREALEAQLREKDAAYALYGEHYLQFADDEKVGFLLLNQEQTDTDSYVQYGEYVPEGQAIQIYTLEWKGHS
ncbi:MAG: hypothetical protein SO015_06180 [Wujia sp.]|nr:hypothetical protein [Wujia sp.]MDY3727728.1 hypothetical protein [Wujia sp.]